VHVYIKKKWKRIAVECVLCGECQFGQKTSTIFSMCHLFSVTQYQYQ